MLFLVFALLFVLGASLLASGVASAVASVLALAGLKAVGHFIAALVPALIGTVIAMGSAAAATFTYLHLSESPAAAFE